MNQSKSIKPEATLQYEELADEERREALRRLGKYAAYTAPVMLALLIPKRCLADSGTPRP